MSQNLPPIVAVSVTASDLSPNRPVETDADKKLVSSAVKVYRALVTQTDESDPEAIVHENSLGGTVVWTYDSEGHYFATLAGAFPADKTYLSSGIIDAETHANYSLKRVDNDTLLLTTSTNDGVMNAQMNSTPVEIRIVP